MVARITTPASLQETLNYNEHKVKKGVAECIAENNFLLPLSALNFYHKLHWFENRNALNNRANTKTIHISLNFDPSEKHSYSKLSEIANDYMTRIGFGEQPYLVYSHHDAGHPHIHIVASTIREDGTHIDLHYIGRDHSEPARKAIEEKFNLVRAKKREEKVIKTLAPVKLEKAVYGKSETRRGIANVLKQVLTLYNYTSLAELNAVLKELGVVADRGNRDSFTWRNNGLLYRLLDSNGNPTGIPIKASAIAGKPTLAYLEKRFEQNKRDRDIPKLSLKNAIDKVLSNDPRNLNQFIALLKAENINTVLRQNAEGRIYGITFVDHRNRAVFNGSEIGKSYSIAGLSQKLNEQHTEQHSYSKQEEQKNDFALISNLLEPENELTETPRHLKKKRKKKKYL